MSDLTKKSNMFYLAFFLLAVCAVATALMAAVAVVTKPAIDENSEKKTLDGLKVVLDGVEYDNDPTAEKIIAKASDDSSEVVIYPATLKGVPVAYALKASTNNGYGGKIEGLIGVDSEGKIKKYIISESNETPGIGTKITARVSKRKLSDIITGKEADKTLPPNKTLDSFEGKSASNGKKWTKNDVEFVTGATVSSTAVTDLAWRAAHTLENHIRDVKNNKTAENKVESGE